MNKLATLLQRFLPDRILRLFEGFWTVPVTLAAFGLASGVMVGALPEALSRPFLERIELASARQVLALVGSGVMTAASIVFSLVFVTLSLTAQQLSPRILDYVLRERIAQVMIGMAVATFLFVVAALLLTGETRPGGLVLAAALAVPLAAATLFLVVLFAYRMTRIIRADEMVARLAASFVAAARRASGPVNDCPAASEALPAATFAGATEIRSRNAGYAGRIDFAALLKLAEQRELLISLEVLPNAYVLPGRTIARVAGLHPGDDPPASEIEAALALTDRRAPGSDPDFEGAALAEAALRALSPGINDPATARAALNGLYEGLAILAVSPPPEETLGAPVPRVTRQVRGLPEFLATLVAPVAEAAARDTQVTAHILELTRDLARLATRDADRAALMALETHTADGHPDRAIAPSGS